MKKILFMVSSMNIGGVEKSLLSLLDTIPQQEYEVTVLMLEKKGGFLTFIPDWVHVEEVEWFQTIKSLLMQSPHQILKTYTRQCMLLKALDFLVCYIGTKYSRDRSIYYKHVMRQIPNCTTTYDIAIAYPGPTEIIDNYIIQRVSARQKVQWIHFDLEQVKPNRKLYEKLFKQFDKICVVSKEASEKMLKNYAINKEKVRVFPNVIASSLITSLAQESKSLDKAFKGIKLVTVGRLSLEKGQDMGIEVLRRLKEEGYSVRWYCIGDGNAREVYEERIKQYKLEEDFLLLGAMPNPYPYMQQADLYVQTSRHEGFCLTLAEALCLKKPILTTNFTGAKEQIQQGYNGFITQATEEELYRNIKYLLDNPLEINKLSQYRVS